VNALRFALLLTGALAVSAQAAEGDGPSRPAGGPPRGPEPLPSTEEIQTIRRILELPPERLSRIRVAIEKLERMSPDARADYATRLAKYEQAGPEERQKIMKEMRERGFSARLLEHHFKAMPAAQANEERARARGAAGLQPQAGGEVRGRIRQGQEGRRQEGRRQAPQGRTRRADRRGEVGPPSELLPPGGVAVAPAVVRPEPVRAGLVGGP
jgi:hypothetical protein